MRIALLFEYPTVNGGERSMLQVIESLAGSEADFVAVAPAEGRLAEALHEARIEHVPLDLQDASGIRLRRDAARDRLIERIGRISPDLAHANSLAMGRLTGSIAERLSMPCTTHLRDIIRLRPAAVSDLNRNQRLFAVSRATRDFHVAQGIDAARTEVVYNGVDHERFRPRPASGALRRELNLPESSFVILTIGQIGLRKGQDVLADAAPEIAASVPTVHFVIVGERNSTKAESVAFEQEFVARFHRAGLQDRLHLLGYREDVDRMLCEADMLVHPAKQEPLGRVLLEAAAAGLPIVATAVGGTPEILSDRVSARLVPPGDSKALAGATIEIAIDAEMRGRFAEAARSKIISDFGARRAARRLCDAWKRACR